jgi:hypothetical protein
MSMELWQRLKDLEKKVQEHSDRLKALERQQPPTGWIDRINDIALEIEPSPAPATRIAGAPKLHKLCPKCGKAPGYFFHVKYCKGNAEVA